jgi:hypothetical protein
MRAWECRGTSRAGHTYGLDGHVRMGQQMVRKIITKIHSHFIFSYLLLPTGEGKWSTTGWYESVEEGSHRKWPFKPRQVVHSSGRSSTGELLAYFCYIFIIIGVLTFTICFSLQKKYKEEVVKKHDECFNYEEDLIDGRAIYDSGGGKSNGRLDRCIVLFNFLNARYDTSYYCWLLFFKVCSVRWGDGL